MSVHDNGRASHVWYWPLLGGRDARAVDAEASTSLAEGAQMAVGKADAAVEVTVARLMVAAEGGSVGRIMVAAGGAGRWPG